MFADPDKSIAGFSVYGQNASLIVTDLILFFLNLERQAPAKRMQPRR